MMFEEELPSDSQQYIEMEYEADANAHGDSEEGDGDGDGWGYGDGGIFGGGPSAGHKRI